MFAGRGLFPISQTAGLTESDLEVTEEQRAYKDCLCEPNRTHSTSLFDVERHEAKQRLVEHHVPIFFTVRWLERMAETQTSISTQVELLEGRDVLEGT